MAEKKKKFGANGLNALESAIETVSEAVENQQTESSQIVASAPVVEPTAEVAPQTSIATKQEQTSPVVQAPAFVPAPATSPVQPVVQQAMATAAATTEAATQEDVKGLNVPLPLSVYKRLSNLKIDSDGETLKSLGLKAVIEFLDKSGY